MDAVIERIKTETSAIVDKATEIARVDSPEAEARAGEFLAQVKRRGKIMDEARTKLVKPLNDHVKMINAEFAKTLKPLTEAETLVKQGLTAYRNSEEVRKAAERRRELEDEAKQAVREGDTSTLAALTPAYKDTLEVAPKAVVTKTGTMRYRKQTRWEISDMSLLPAEYWQPNEDKIAAEVKAGVEIPGVRIWTEEVPVNGSF